MLEAQEYKLSDNPKGTQKFFVYIHKSYFPATKSAPGKEDFENWTVDAVSRESAARLVWDRNGTRLLKLMRPNETRLPRKVSLYVSGTNPKQGSVVTNAGRLPAILVYTGYK